MLFSMLVARKKLKLSQQELADRTGIQVKRLGKIERGELQATVYEGIRLAKVLGQPIETIFLESDAS